MYNPDLSRALSALRKSGCSCAVCLNGHVLIGEGSGVRPLLGWLSDGTSLAGYSAADKVVGKAAAMLYLLLGVRCVYADVISAAGIEMLRAHGIEVQYGKLVPRILARDGQSLCPMEAAVQALSDPAQAPAALREKLALLMSRNGHNGG